MRQLSIAYIAGFFDGEGCIRMTGNGGLHWMVAQAGPRGKAVLQEIAAVFQQYGITAAFHTATIKKGQNLPGHKLYLSSRRDVLFVCKLLLPYLRVKRVEVADVLRYCTVFPPIVAGTPAFRLRTREGCQTRRRVGYNDSAWRNTQ